MWFLLLLLNSHISLICAGWQNKAWWQSHSSGWWACSWPVCGWGIKHTNSQHTHTQYALQALDLITCHLYVYSGVQFDGQTPGHCQALHQPLHTSLLLFHTPSPYVSLPSLLDHSCVLPNPPFSIHLLFIRQYSTVWLAGICTNNFRPPELPNCSRQRDHTGDLQRKCRPGPQHCRRMWHSAGMIN